MRRAILLLILALAFLMTACSERPSAIVRRAEGAGAGNLSMASFSAMQSWLDQHRSVALDLDRLCADVRPVAPARWSDTTEGRLCAAARNVEASAFKPLESDHKTYESGWK